MMHHDYLILSCDFLFTWFLSSHSSEFHMSPIPRVLYPGPSCIMAHDFRTDLLNLHHLQGLLDAVVALAVYRLCS